MPLLKMCEDFFQRRFLIGLTPTEGKDLIHSRPMSKKEERLLLFLRSFEAQVTESALTSIIQLILVHLKSEREWSSYVQGTARIFPTWFPHIRMILGLD